MRVYLKTKWSKRRDVRWLSADFGGVGVVVMVMPESQIEELERLRWVGSWGESWLRVKPFSKMGEKELKKEKKSVQNTYKENGGGGFSCPYLIPSTKQLLMVFLIYLYVFRTPLALNFAKRSSHSKVPQNNSASRSCLRKYHTTSHKRFGQFTFHVMNLEGLALNFGS